MLNSVQRALLRAFVAVGMGWLALSIVATTATGQTSRKKIFFVNAGIGAATAAVGEILSGQLSWQGVLGGAAGGMTVYAGKCIVAQQRSATDWLGHATVALGSSMVANASKGEAILQELAIPIGPISLRRTAPKRHWRVRADLPTLAGAAYFLTRPHAKFALQKSLAHGVLVVENASANLDISVGQMILLRPTSPRSSIAHELTHASQDVFLSAAFEYPLEDALSSIIPGGATVHKYVDVGILSPAWAAANALLPVWSRPWEMEARRLASGC